MVALVEHLRDLRHQHEIAQYQRGEAGYAAKLAAAATVRVQPASLCNSRATTERP
jgi:hypothetical protein